MEISLFHWWIKTCSEKITQIKIKNEVKNCKIKKLKTPKTIITTKERAHRNEEIEGWYYWNRYGF